MRRFLLLLLNEFKSSRTAMAVNAIAIFQPTLIFILMAVIMVVPTFEMNVVTPKTKVGHNLVDAMAEVGSPIGPDYIEASIVEDAEPEHRQVIEVVQLEGNPVAVQTYGFIDSNLVKNLRNRLKAALLILWETDLDSKAITLVEHPWLPRDVPYTVYFGMAMIPLAAYLASSLIGGYLIAQEFENQTILEYRMSPIPAWLILAAKFSRLIITGLVAGLLLYVALGVTTGVWASSTLMVFLIIIPQILLAACLGLAAGLITRSSLPSFLLSLATAFGFWLIGCGFGLAAGFSDVFETISRMIPNTPTIELMFPYFYSGRVVADNVGLAILQLGIYCFVLLILVIALYQKRVLSKES